MTTFTVTLPTHTLDALNKMLCEIAAGNALEIVPLHAKLTTQDAANFLNVSRPYLVKLLEEGKLPFHKTGRHRRVLFADLLAWKQQREQQSAISLPVWHFPSRRTIRNFRIVEC